MHVPQTVGFELRCSYVPDGFDHKIHADFVFHDFGKMLERYYKEKKRRKISDQAISAEYRLFLTDHGKRACESDEDCAKRHENVGKWMNLTI